MSDADLAELLAHFFRPLHAHCPACGSPACPYWQRVRELAPVDASTVLAIEGAGVTPR